MGKSSHHKTGNVFRFQSFSERIANVNIDVIHRIRHQEETPQEDETYFGKALEKWSDLNCTEHFTNFRREITEQVQTYNQLVHNEDEIVAALQKHLQVAASLAFTPLLDLVVQLARDLQKDFYRHFQDFFDILISLLNNHSQDADLLEQLFTCLSYLFKFLWRYLVRDIRDVFSFFSTLLGKKYKEYIRNFAAESFAFLMRKVKDTSGLFDFMLLSLHDNPDRSEGVGRLMFEMMKGVKVHFHSCHIQVFPILLSKTIEYNDGLTQLPWELSERALSEMFLSVAKHTDKENATSLWNLALGFLTDVYSSWLKANKVKKDHLAQQIKHLVTLINIWVDYRNGIMMKDPNKIATHLHELLKGAKLTEDVGVSILEVASCLLIKAPKSISIECTSKLVTSVYKTKYSCAAIYDFTKKLFDLSIFEKDVLPCLLPYCHLVTTGHNDDHTELSLLLVTRLLLHKCPLPEDGSCLQDSLTYMLDFGIRCLRSGLPEYILSVVRHVDEKTLQETSGTARLWSALVCLPHVRPLIHKDEAVEKIKDLIKLMTTVLSEKLTECKEHLLFLLYQIVVTLTYMQHAGELFNWLSSQTLIQLLLDHPTSIHMLRASDLYFTQATLDDRTSLLSQETLMKFFPSLEPNLSSPHSQVRLLTLRILAHFELPVGNMNVEQVGVFHICLEAEKVKLSIHDYRQRLMHLQKLEYSLVQNRIPVGGFERVPLMYLLGNLFCNFKLLWKPLRTLIATYAQSLSRETFWEIYGECLEYAASETEKLLYLSVDDYSRVPDEQLDDLVFPQLFSNQMTLLCTEQDRPDFNNFRYQLWKTMEGFSDKCEAKSRILSPLLFRFLKNEYYPGDLSVAPSQNLLKYSNSDDLNTDAVVMDIPEDTVVSKIFNKNKSDIQSRGKNKRKLSTVTTENMDIADQKDESDVVHHVSKSQENKLIVQKNRRRAATGTLIVHLKLFATFKGPKSLFMEHELADLYQELLVHLSPTVQRVAFDCIMTYKHPYLLPYQENFNRLLDEKTFKNEIVSFSIDSESGVIRAEHRPELLSVLMRILYGMMQHKTGKDTAGKAHANVRRSIVFRFLNGCQMDELKIFIDLVFALFSDFIADDPYQKVKDIRNNLNLAKIIPLRKIQGAMNTIETIFKKLGHLLDNYLPSLLQIILGLAALCAGCLDCRSRISPAAVNLLKSLRQMAITRLIQFGEEFGEYELSAMEIDAIFEAVVWPQLSKLPMEGIHSPTPLFKLLCSWSKYPKYFNLLLKHHEDDSSLTSLPFVFQLLLVKGLNSKVSTAIMEMVHTLLEDTDVDNSEIKVLAVNHMIKPSSPNTRKTEGDDLENLGIGLLLPHIPAILQYIQGSIVGLVVVMKKQHSCRELNILSRISAYVTDSVQCSTIISLLFPFLGKVRSEETEVDILKTVLNLGKSVDDKKKFFRPVSKLFSSLKSRPARSILCQILKEMAENKSLKDVAELIEQLNAWDKKRVDEPDYSVRIAAFKAINQNLRDSQDFSADVLLPIVHNCCFFILHVDDMSLRDNSSHCLVTMIKELKRADCERALFKKIVMQNIVAAVKSGLKSRNENARHDFLTVLVALIDTFPAHPAFTDLKTLRDSDVEVDFFENIKHIQIHRRTRALRKLNKHLIESPMRKELIMSYFMPIVTTFILDETYSKHTGLLDAAVETISVLCRQLPWHLYLQHLKYYLIAITKKKEVHKLLVRVIVALLDAFHFDLSRSEFKVRTAPAVSRRKKVQQDATETEDMDNLIEDVEERTGKKICSAALATRIHKIMITDVLPQLHRCLIEKIRSEEEHKLARSNYAEDNEILRVPIALAVIKLLQKLPVGSMENRLPGILIKVCNFLKSRSKDIRVTARSTLGKILLALGPRYFFFILMELRGTLRRGYQLHVLCFTVHRLLNDMSSLIKPGDLDHCLKTLQEVFNEELFGKLAEEKEVSGITGKVFEARSSKSFDSYQILAQYVSTASLSQLITPLKQILETTHSHTTARKVHEVLNRVANGILENKGITIETLMVFIHGLTSETLPLLVEKKKEVSKTETDPRLKPKSCLLLLSEPKRIGQKARSSKKTNLHIIVEFGLQLLHMCLKGSRIVRLKTSHQQLVDPFIAILIDCLDSKHVRINSMSLRCLSWVLKFPLPSLDSQITKIANAMFILLKNYASAGAARGDNLDLVTNCFKTVTILVRDVKSHNISTEELQVLLTFCEEDIQDYTRQSTAFTLLKAILSRKLKVPEIEDIMDRVEKMTITAETPHVRRESRQVMLQYLLYYPLGKKIQRHLEFFLTQLSYDLESGRESALEMLATIFSAFPKSKLSQYCGLFFVPMSAALVNDESTHCRKMIALAIKSLIEKLEHNDQAELFSIVITWFSDKKKIKHRKLAAQLCGLFIDAGSSNFQHHLTNVMPIIEQQLEPDIYVQVEDEWKEGELDNLLYNILATLVKLLHECDLLRKAKWAQNLSIILDHVQSHLLHPHMWVRLAAAQVFGLVFAAWQPEDLVSMATGNQGGETPTEYLLLDTRQKMEKLALDFTEQLKSRYLNKELADQVIKNLVFVAKIGKQFSVVDSKSKSVHDDEQETKIAPQLSLPWLTRKMVREANHEAVNDAKVTIKRSSVFKWIAAISLDFGSALVTSLLHILLPPLQREITGFNNTEDSVLKKLAQEVIDVMKKVVGVEGFTEVYADIHKIRSERKETRKRQQAILSVSNPEIAARKKIKKNLAKITSKKRKIVEMNPMKKRKKRKTENAGR